MRGTEFSNCRDLKAELRQDDKLLLLGKRADLRAFSDAL